MSAANVLNFGVVNWERLRPDLLIVRSNIGTVRQRDFRTFGKLDGLTYVGSRSYRQQQRAAYRIRGSSTKPYDTVKVSLLL